MNIDYIEKYWVGLMDGNGSIQINNCKNKNLKYRLVIKLKKNINNITMLEQIKEIIGGKVIIYKEDILWIVDNIKTIKTIMKIFNKYPPLTTRLQCQLKFMIECYNHNNIMIYLKDRNLKYNNQINLLRKDFILPEYFNSWLSGFIEVEGHFNINKNPSFSIGKNIDLYLIESIKSLFKARNKIYIRKDNYYILEIYNKEILIKIINHFQLFPLLGDKYNSLNKFSLEINK